MVILSIIQYNFDINKRFFTITLNIEKVFFMKNQLHSSRKNTILQP